ncbi:hypothetical protein N9W84_00775 [bacterium]|nr:hypothetical protein [bacterium]
MLKELHSYLLKSGFLSEAAYLRKLSNSELEFSAVCVTSEKVANAIKKLSKETGHLEAVLTELYCEDPDEMNKILFPKVARNEIISAENNSGNFSEKYNLKVKTIGNIHVLETSADPGADDYYLDAWPFKYNTNFSDMGYGFKDLLPLLKKFVVIDKETGRRTKGEKAKYLLGTPDGASCKYYIDIGCGYFYITNLDTGTGKGVVKKIPGARARTIVITARSRYNIYARKEDLSGNLRKIADKLDGCKIDESLKSINKKERLKYLIDKTIQSNTPTNIEDPRVPEPTSGGPGYGKIEYFVFKDYSPTKYKEFSGNRKSKPVPIFLSVLNKIKDENISLYNNLMKQKLSEYDKIKQNKDEEELRQLLQNHLTLDEIESAASKYSGGDLLPDPNIPLDYDIGDEITPSGKKIEKSLAPQFERRFK